MGPASTRYLISETFTHRKVGWAILHDPSVLSHPFAKRRPFGSCFFYRAGVRLLPLNGGARNLGCVGRRYRHDGEDSPVSAQSQAREPKPSRVERSGGAFLIMPMNGFIPSANEGVARRARVFFFMNEAMRAFRETFLAEGVDGTGMKIKLRGMKQRQAPRSAATAAARMRGAVCAAGMPVQISSDFAPWCTSMARPLARGRPRARAWVSRAVSGGL